MSSSSNQKVRFFSDGTHPGLKNRKKLKIFIEQLFKNEKVNLGVINYIFTTDKKLLKINKKYLNHDFFTDIITFELNQPNCHSFSDVYISIDRVRENAKLLRISPTFELHRVIFHGSLHLCHYSDKDKASLKKMRAREDYYLRRYFK